jgi:hypothetical protein
MDVSELIIQECDRIKTLLLAKNQAYGNACVDPIRVFSRADPVEQIKVRIDDKLSRLMRGQHQDAVPEDTEQDLIGYLILLRVARQAVAQR